MLVCKQHYPTKRGTQVMLEGHFCVVDGFCPGIFWVYNHSQCEKENH